MWKKVFLKVYNKKMEYIVIFATTPIEDGKKIAKHLIEGKTAVCVNVIPKVYSIFWWEGKIEECDEALLVIKTEKTRLDEVINSIKDIHPYEVPEIIAVSIIGGNKKYLDWLTESLAL